jgi:glycosyltransferase involved in cell wall biosynthesis
MIRTAKRLGRTATRSADYIQKRLFKAGGGKRYARRLRLAAGTPPPFSGRLVVDLSVISQNDAGTGIQRVVRAIAFHLARLHQDSSTSIEFVACRGRKHYRLELSDGQYRLTKEPFSYRAGDLFLGLDFSLDALWRMRGELARMRRSGVLFWYLIHDFLPLTQPQWFSAPTVLRFANWLAILAGTADGFFCVSAPVARQLAEVMRERFGIVDCPPVRVIPMGWDLAGSQPSTGLPAGFDELLAQLAGAPMLLQVGTIEPRKGHADSLAAMELLWKRGSNMRLLLVGSAGWKVDDFLTKLQGHHEYGRRLFWTGRISDEALDRIYARCSGVIFPSLAEGFGLPVVEALAHGKPVLARRLDVLEPLEGGGVTLFEPNISHAALADTIDVWLAKSGTTEPKETPTRATWHDSAMAILRTLNDQRIDRK